MSLPGRRQDLSNPTRKGSEEGAFSRHDNHRRRNSPLSAGPFRPPSSTEFPRWFKINCKFNGLLPGSMSTGNARERKRGDT